MTDIDFMTPNDKEWLVQIADALDAAERIYPNIIQMSDELARQIADGLRKVSEALPDDELGDELKRHMRRVEILAGAYENEAVKISAEELEAIYDNDVFETMRLQDE